MTSDFNIWQF